MALLLAALALQDDVARWIEELSHESIEVRDAAERKLIEAGPAKARKSLEAVRIGTGEVQARVRRILEFFDWGITAEEKAHIDALLGRSNILSGNDPRELSPDLPPEVLREWRRLGAKSAKYLAHRFQAEADPRRGFDILYVGGLTHSPDFLPAAHRALQARDKGLRYFGVLACRTIRHESSLIPLGECLGDAADITLCLTAGRPFRIQEAAAEAMEIIHGMPVDPAGWLDPFRRYPYMPEVRRVQEWWSRNQGRTASERQGDARETARELMKMESTVLQGCIVLLYSGGEDRRLLEEVFRLVRPDTTGRARKDRKKALGLLQDGAWEDFSLAVDLDRAVSEWMIEVLQDRDRKGDWRDSLGLAYTLFTPKSRKDTEPRSWYPMQSVRPILPHFLFHDDPEVRHLAALLLASMGDDRGSEILIRFIEKPQDLAAVKYWDAGVGPAIRALGNCKSIASRAALRTVLGSESRKLRNAALWALTQTGDEEILPVLRAMLFSPEDGFRAFTHLYDLRREEALQWARTTKSEPSPYLWLLRKGEPLGFELALKHDAPTAHYLLLSVGRELVEIPASSIVPLVLQAVAKGDSIARDFLHLIARGHGVETMTPAQLDDWWRKVEGTFEFDRTWILEECELYTFRARTK